MRGHPSTSAVDGSPASVATKADGAETVWRTRRRRASPCDRALDMRSREHLLGVKPIVRLAEDTEIRHLSAATERAGLDMVDLEESARRTAITNFVLVRAALPVALENLPARGARDGTRARTTTAARVLGLAEKLFLEDLEQSVERSTEDDLEPAVRIAMAHQISCAFEFVAHLLACRQLHREARWRELGNVRHRRRGRRGQRHSRRGRDRQHRLLWERRD